MDPDPALQGMLLLLAEQSPDLLLATWLAATIVIGLVFSALFSGAEVALFSLNPLVKPESSTSSDVLIDQLIAKPRRLLATILIGNTFANVITSVAAAVLTADFAHAMALPSSVVLVLEVVIITFVILILSEITPKTLAINNPLALSRFFARPIYFFFVLLRPFAVFMASSAWFLERRLPKPDTKLHSSDIRTIARVGTEQGTIKNDEQELIENVIEFGNTTAKEIMTSRVNIEAVSVDDSLDKVVKIIQEEGFSRMPLYKDDIDHIVGIVFSKDVLPYLYSKSDQEPIVNWKTLAKPVLFIPGTKKLDDLLREFQQKKTHMAIVVDEYGGTEGLITLDDLLEEIIGDFQDEYSVDEDLPYTRLKNGSYLFDPSIDLDDMEEVLDCTLTTNQDEYETLGGLVYHLMERLPKEGESVVFNGLELFVQHVERNRIRKVRVRKLRSGLKAEER